VDIWFVDDPDRQPDLAHARDLPKRLTAETPLERVSEPAPFPLEFTHRVMPHPARSRQGILPGTADVLPMMLVRMAWTTTRSTSTAGTVLLHRSVAAVGGAAAG
jgi:hypothetical protein